MANILLETVLGTSFESDLVKDILSIIMVFSAKLYGNRSKENKLINEFEAAHGEKL